MDLFNSLRPPQTNLLPFDGLVNDYSLILSPTQADVCLQHLLQHIPWQHDRVVIRGQTLTTGRQVAWYGDQPFAYTYSGTTKRALPWPPYLNQLKTLVESHSGDHFNACLLNLYHHGNQAMAWHSDNEAALQPHAAIASLSLGATRIFGFKHKRRGTLLKLPLHHGQLIVMRGATQSHWLHALLKDSALTEPRINLTFRTMRHTTINY